ncbi:MAG: helix-turn-helix domain-containing protein [candidate division WOR-3 bacterium]
MANKNRNNSPVNKKNKEWYTLSEVAKITKIPPQTVKYWQKAYKINLEKNKSGKYLYTRDDVNKILLIKQLRLRDKLSVAGVKKKLAQFAKCGFKETTAEDVKIKKANIFSENTLLSVQKELIIIKGLLEQLINDISIPEK